MADGVGKRQDQCKLTQQRQQLHGRSQAYRPRTALVVLGMHRSGTSAVTRVLGLLGAALPKQPMLSLKNEDHWEPERLVRLHEAMLEEAGSRWDDWRAFDPASLGKRLDHYKSRIKTILAEEYADAQLMVIKDPRMCRFVPLYNDVLAELDITPRFVLLQRNPLAVTASLAQAQPHDARLRRTALVEACA